MKRFIVISSDEDAVSEEVVPLKNYPVYTVTLGWIDGPEDIERLQKRHHWGIDVLDYDPEDAKKPLARYARKIHDTLKGFKKDGFSWYTQEFKNRLGSRSSVTTVMLDTPDDLKTIHVEDEIMWSVDTGVTELWGGGNLIFTPEELEQIENISID